MTIDRKNCPMRHAETGNCLVAGGFCVDAISDEMCEALHNAYDSGYYDALRAQQEAEKNEPLTRDELLTMNGKPVWCEDGNGNACWCLICVRHDKGCVFMDAVDNETGLWDGDYYGMTGDGKHGLHLLGWIAYRHPPKEAPNV